jgi:hypothetical protein
MLQEIAMMAAIAKSPYHIGATRLGSSAVDSLRPITDRKFDWPRQISFLNI